ncbi:MULTISPECIES: phage baseplate assembly protein V [unclassified Polaromonas]|jgi:phage baseplate assembly protein V|uniref:phage baseplate assembly protein V n=1 Tax=unclassified Polaromonas TaxID=2638319 RepID=UPI000BC5795B|nr:MULTISPECIES: phage baseplate assembly protein V [unclassified Polaromonas]OYY34578.1 MAG: hypothetical protein B7Y60_15985 [Polaromonas sp. 35-63-35]OYZ15067.1 MAG: hypothetical protein B7Y28_22625 [Polaromonas sp. 16-63-31]OYZ78862.1 MAG: hypothetical protein B7Y09_11305 [Polaromonas sp. 24-63-21]OZA49624.1 MAG: hypothetical protein B7X88_14525 [Polaromonas sp. 17-63-33]OZA86832.1 MAG: hypothetical protein B7X65_15295 [Polaromonas sp. 39-63-25]
MIDQIRREVTRGLSGVRSALRGFLHGINLAQRIQRVEAEGLAGEELPGLELMQQFGFTSAPPAGSQLIIIPLGGRTSASVVVATEHGAFRFKLDNQGETAIYNQWGDLIHLRKDRSIRVVAALKVEMETPLLNVTGAIHAGQNITTDQSVVAAVDVKDQGGAKSMAGMRDIYNLHDHPETEVTTLQPNQAM